MKKDVLKINADNKVVKPFVIMIALFFIANLGNTQQTTGIKFEKKLRWSDIKQKAKHENKYIFVDAYTTWCGPCKYMAENIFTQDQVGDFFNKNFINVAIQIDSTKQDDEYVKSWYRDAKTIAQLYRIQAYPTYLLFNQNGVLVQTIVGANNSADSFIVNVKNALDPKSQYSNLKREYKNGRRDTSLLLSLINAATIADDDSSLHIYANSYLAKQTNLLTSQNIKLIDQVTTKSNDIGFKILNNYPKEVEVIIGKEERIRLLNTIAFDEEIFPVIMINGKKTTYRGGLSVYGGGKMNKNVDWSIIETKIASKYNSLTERIILNGKLKYYDWLEDWGNFNALLLDYTSGKNAVDTALIYYMAGKFLEDCKDKRSFKDAISWASILTKNENYPYYFQTYSLLLYKAEEKKSAMQYMEKCALLLKNSDESITELIEKMKKNEEIE
jgi:thioredoxin-related protein